MEISRYFFSYLKLCILVHLKQRHFPASAMIKNLKTKILPKKVYFLIFKGFYFNPHLLRGLPSMVVHSCNSNTQQAEAEDLEIKASQNYISSRRPGLVTWQDPVSKKPRPKDTVQWQSIWLAGAKPCPPPHKTGLMIPVLQSVNICKFKLNKKHKSL